MNDPAETSADPIAEIRRHLRSLQDPSALLEGLFLLAPVALQIYDTNGQSLAVNPKFREIFGSVPPPEYNLFRDEVAGRQGLLDSFRRAFQGETVEVGPTWYDPRDLEHVEITEGRRVAVKGVAFPLLDAAGAVRHVAMIFSDVTRELEDDAALRANERRFRALIENSADGVAMIDSAGIVRYQSPAFTRILGYSIEEDVGRPALSQVHPDDRDDVLRVMRELAMVPGCTSRWRYRVRHRNGSWRWIESIVTNLVDDAFVHSFVFNYRDVTEAVEAEEQIGQLNDELEARVVERTGQLAAANHDLEAFSYSVSHDLRAPLRAIAGFTSIVMREHARVMPADALVQLEKVVRNTQQMSLLIDQLLAFARLGRQPIHRVPVALGEIVHDVLEELRAEREGRDVEIVIGELAECDCDPGLMKRVLSNLLSNALKYTRRRERARVEIGCRREGDRVVYFVRDNGAGFDMRYAHKLFGVFQRLHLAEEYEGVGVGLAMVERIVQRHGGRIWAEGAVDQGATFYWMLDEDGAQAPAPHADPSPGRREA